jgi:hypothetical protein
MKPKGIKHKNGSRRKDKMTDAEKRMLLTFNENTFTLEIPHSKTRDLLEEAGLILKHPGGPFGSRLSYYRTQEGMAVWRQLHEETS